MNSSHANVAKSFVLGFLISGAWIFMANVYSAMKSAPSDHAESESEGYFGGSEGGVEEQSLGNDIGYLKAHGPIEASNPTRAETVHMINQATELIEEVNDMKTSVEIITYEIK